MSQVTEPSSPLAIQRLPRACHEALILSILTTGAHHGYQLALELEEKSSGAFRFNHGTLYPILHRLERDQLIRGDWLDEKSERKRKRYSLTPSGRRRLAELASAWRGFFTHFFSVIEEAES